LTRARVYNNRGTFWPLARPRFTASSSADRGKSLHQPQPPRNQKSAPPSGTMWTAMRVESLEPLSTLSGLERLILSNVRVRDRRLRPLLGLSHLTEIRLPKFFPRDELEAVRREFPSAKLSWPQGE